MTISEMSDAPHGFYCQLWADHDLEEQYYGYRCKKCDLFIPYGSEPWIVEAEEEVYNLLDYRNGESCTMARPAATG